MGESVRYPRTAEIMKSVEAGMVQASREGGEKALFHALCLIERLPLRDPLPGETPAQWQGAYKALIEAQLHLLAEQIEAGRINLAPLPKPSDKSGGRQP